MIRTLVELIAAWGVTKTIRSDNWSEFVARVIGRWLKQVDVETLYVAPSSPWENGYAENFHFCLRDDF